MQQRTISLSDCDTQQRVNFLRQPAITNSAVELRRRSKALPKAKTCTKKKIVVTVWWSAADLIHYSFLNPSKTIVSEKYAQQISELPWKLQHLQPALVNRKDSVLLHDSAQLHVTQPTLQKLNELGYGILPYLPYPPDLLSTSYHSFKHLGNFLQGKWFYNLHKAENAFQEFVKSLSMDVYALGINKLISRWQRCVDCNGSYFHYLRWIWA